MPRVLVTINIDEHFVRTTQVRMEVEVPTANENDIDLDDQIMAVENWVANGWSAERRPLDWRIKRGQLKDLETEVYLEGYEEL